MYYGTTTTGTPIPPDDWRVRAFRAVFWFIPRANPDNEKLFPRVTRWLLEIDETGRPFREIGLDAAGSPLFGAPNEKNFGYFTDSDATFAKSDLALVDRAEFEKHWKAVTPGRKP